MQDDHDAEFVEWRRFVDLPGVEILLAERCRRLWRIYHETYTICTLRDCDQSVWGYRRKVHSASSGDTMLMEPGEVHVTMKLLPGPVSFRVTLLTPALIDAAANELSVKSKQPHLKTASITHARLFRAFARLHASLEQESSVLERQSRLAQCVELFLENCTESSPRPCKHPGRPILLRVREFIREHHARNIALNDLVNVSGLSRYHLLRAFAAEFGLPPHTYQLQVRIAKARGLLAAGAPASGAAAETGFADQSHFARHFKRACGVTPSEYATGSTDLSRARAFSDCPAR